MCFAAELTGIAGGAPKKAVLAAEPEVIPHDREAMSAHVRGPTYSVRAAFMTLRRRVRSAPSTRCSVDSLRTAREDVDTGSRAIRQRRCPIANFQGQQDSHCRASLRRDSLYSVFRQGYYYHCAAMSMEKICHRLAAAWLRSLAKLPPLRLPPRSSCKYSTVPGALPCACEFSKIRDHRASLARCGCRVQRVL